MAEHKHGSMDAAQNEKAWVYFVNFWKFFFIAFIILMIFLAIVGT